MTEATTSGRQHAYDELPSSTQAAIRDQWVLDMDTARDQLNLATELADAGRTWAELDSDGNVVTRS